MNATKKSLKDYLFFLINTMARVPVSQYNSLHTNDLKNLVINPFPSGVYHEWKANSTGRSAQTVREFLEKNYTPEIAANDDQVVKLAIRALLEVVQGKNLEVAIMKYQTQMKLLSTSEVDAIVAEIEKEKEEVTQ